MMRFLSISVTFLDPRYHGCGNDDRPEWPPSPMRLFQALVAGSRTGWRNGRWSDSPDDPLRAAFEWLERREPPEIVAPRSHEAAAYTLFVPSNDSDRKFERPELLTSKVVRPRRITGGPEGADRGLQLHYLWPVGDDLDRDVKAHVEVLCRESRHLIALGWGIDQVVGDGRVLSAAEAAALPGTRWRAWRGHFPGQERLRVPTEGSLRDLEAAHRSFVDRVRATSRGRTTVLEYTPARKPNRFDTVVYRHAGHLPPRSWAVFELPDGVAFRQERAVEVAAMLRSLTCDDQRYRNRRDFQEQFPDIAPEIYLAGHIKGDGERGGPTPPRFSYLPLPSIGHEHADGMIRRLLIAEPFGGVGAHARWAQQRLHGQTLRDKDGQQRGILLGLWRTNSASVVKRYVGESSTWASVTPVILPGFDDAKGFKGIPADRLNRPTKAERLLLKAVLQAGLPIEAVRHFTLRKAPYWVGSQHPDLYRRPDYLDSARKRRFSAWHVHLEFRDPIGGPLCIGAGRHCGLGLFAIWPP